MNSIAKPNEITNFGQWCEAQYYAGGIRVLDDDPEEAQTLVTPNSTLDAAFRWLAVRCNPKSGESCMDFIHDEILEEQNDNYAAKLLFHILTEADPLVVAEMAKELRRHFARRSIEHFETELFALDANEEGPIEAFKRMRDEDDGVSIHDR